MYYEIRELEAKSFQVSLENGKVENAKYSEYRGKSFRVLKNGFWGYFVGNLRDEEGLKKAEKLAIFEADSEVDSTPFEGSFVFKQKKKLEDISVEEKVEFLREIDKILRKEGIVSRKLTYLEVFRNVRIRNSSGGEVSYKVPRCGIIIQAYAKGETLQFYGERLMKVGGFEVVDKAYDVAENVVDTVLKLTKAKTPPSGKMKVVMDPSLTGVFVHEAFGHAVEADHVLQNASVLAGKLGEKVADESVTIYDDPTLEEFGFFPFDDEGFKAERKTIVERGVLKSYLHSRETAKKLGGKAGNGRSDSLDFPIVRMSNTFLSPGDYTLEELLEEVKEGVILFGSRGGETNPATGYFHFNTKYGYIVRRGEIEEMIRDVSLSGKTLETLRNVKVSKDLSFDPGFCGKAGQLVPVADGGPYTLVEAFVGGE